MERSQRVAEFERKHFSRTGKMSVETRLALQTYLRWPTFAAGALFVSFFIISLETTSPSPSVYTNVAVVFFSVAIVSMVAGRIVVREYEKTAYFLGRFSGELKNCLAKTGPKPGLENLEKGLNSYQNVFTYCRIPNIGKRLTQIRLVLDRGTKDEVKELYRSLRILSISMDNCNPSLFDAEFSLLVGSLDEIESKKKDIAVIVVPRRERIKSLLGEMKKPIMFKVLPTVLIFMVLYLIYALSGFKISIG